MISYSLFDEFEECCNGGTGPKGPKGDKGDQGPEGPQGPQGPPGLSAMNLSSVALRTVPPKYTTQRPTDPSVKTYPNNITGVIKGLPRGFSITSIALVSGTNVDVIHSLIEIK